MGVSLVNTEERRELVNLEVTSGSIVWEVRSPQRGINKGIKNICIGQGCIEAKNLDGVTNDVTWFCTHVKCKALTSRKNILWE